MARRSKLTEATLAKLGAKRLAALLLAETATNRELKRALQLELDSEQGADAVANAIRKRLKAISDAQSDLSKAKAQELRSELDDTS